jgi:predicted ATPase
MKPAPARWQLRVLGAVELRDAEGAVLRLPSRAAALLLTRLALAPERQHPREELVEHLWPGVDGATGRNRLRQTLSVLKSLLEPPGAPPVLLADRRALALAPGAIEADVHAARRALAAGDGAGALAHYGGELMPGYFEEWVLEARGQLAAQIEALPLPSGGTAPAAAALAAAPSPDPSPALSHRLPGYLTRLVGAEAALTDLVATVQAARLVVLRGPGGAGKTRLAVEAVRVLAARPGFDAVVFVALASCTRREDMLDALLLALRQDAGNGEPAERVHRALDGRRLLLVLDNFEQLVEVARDDLALWLARNSGLHLLVTSRRALDLDGEVEQALAPLPLPRAGASLAEQAANPALALFVDRARAARSDFHLSARNRELLVEIVGALAGLPLAIELAAARVRSLGLAEMRAMLAAPGGGALALLERAGPRAGGDPRHASMERVLRFSWRLLADDARRMLAALAHCEGGAPLALLAAMCEVAPPAAAARLDALVGASVATLEGDEPGAVRYRTYEPMREFVRAEIGHAGRALARTAHLRALAAWAHTLGREPDLAAVRAEWANLVAALGAATQLGEDGARLAIDAVLDARFALDDLLLPASALTHLRELAAAVPGHRAAALQALLARQSYDFGQSAAAEAHAQAALRADAAAGAADPEHADVLRSAARVLLRLGHDTGAMQRLLERAIAAAQAQGQPDIEALALGQLAVLVVRRDRDYLRNAELNARALALWRGFGPQARMTAGLVNLALAYGFLRRPTDQLPLLDEARARAEALGQRRLLAFATSITGYALADLRRFADSRAAYRRCLELAWEDAAWREWFYALWNLPRTLVCLAQPEAALRLMGFAEGFYVQRFGPLGPEDQREARRTRRLAARRLGPARARALWKQGTALTMAETMALALAATELPT